MINSICFDGNHDEPPELERDLAEFRFEPEFIRMIQIDVNIHLITGVERVQPMEKEGFWILCSAMRDANDGEKFEIYNKMCSILSIFQSSGYSETLITYRAEIHLILNGQKRPLDAAIGMFNILLPELQTDIDALMDLRTPMIHRQLDLFFRYFVPEDASTWNDSLTELHQKMRTKVEWSLFLPHKRFIEELFKNSGSNIFITFWHHVIEESAKSWNENKEIDLEHMDVVDTSRWLESRHWRSAQWKIVHQLQGIFLREQVSGSTLKDVLSSGNGALDAAGNFISEITANGHFRGDLKDCREVLGLLFLDLKEKITLKWNRQYSMGMLKVLYHERIRPQWNLFRRQLHEGQSRVYDIQKHFQVSPWHIDEKMISDEVTKMISNADSGNTQSNNNRTMRTTTDIVSCLQCIESLSVLRIIMDAICMFQNLLSGSKNCSGLEMDLKYQSLQKTLDLVQEFDFYRRYSSCSSTSQEADPSKLGVTELLCLNPGSSMTMVYLLHFWMNHQDIIGKIKCDHEGLKWLFTLCSHDIFVKEFFMLFEDDVQCMTYLPSFVFTPVLSHETCTVFVYVLSDVMYRSQFQNATPQQSEHLIRLNAVRNQLVLSTASALSALTMSDAMDLLLNSILPGITQSDLFKLNALISDWNELEEVKLKRRETQIEEKKDEEQGDDIQNVASDNDKSEVAIWLCHTLKLPEYVELFESEGFAELEMLADLDHSLLKELGINKMAHRLKILKEIRKLSAEIPENEVYADQENEGAPAVVRGANIIDTLR